jgi:hypothetical protein
MASQDPDKGLVKTAISQALTVAADHPAAPNGAGDAEAEAMLAATTTLPPPARAALALTGLTSATPSEVGAAMDLSEQAATALLELGFVGLAQKLRKQPDVTESEYRAWLWAEPPADLWETLYPSFYGAVERQLREGQNGNGKVDAIAPTLEPPRVSRRARRRERRAARTGDRPRRKLGRRM